MTTTPSPAFLAFLTQPAPGVCLLNLQLDRNQPVIQCEIARNDQFGMLIKLADMASQHNSRRDT